MTPRTGWEAAFRAGHAPLAVEALYRGWQSLLARAGNLTPKKKEPELTEMLCLYLQAQRDRDRLTGLWGYENQQGDLVFGAAGARVTRRKRTDIRYFSNLETPELDLIFEFKKLDHRKQTRDKYVGAEGLLRFVTGEYSKRQPMAVMVGILTVHRDDSVPPLERYLDSVEAMTNLLMPPTGGKQARVPSGFFTCADFDTEHTRPADRAPAHGTITISHVFLDFPGLPRASSGNRARRKVIA